MDIEPRDGNGDEPGIDEAVPEIKPICGLVVMLFPNGGFHVEGLDPETHGVERKLYASDVAPLCNLALLHAQVRALSEGIIHTKPSSIVTLGDKPNPMRDRLRQMFGRKGR